MTHYNLVHKFVLVPQAMKIPDAKAAVDKEWKKLETIPAWQLEKVRSKEVILEAQRDKKKSPLCYIDGHKCHFKNAELEPKFQKCEGRVVLRGDTVKDDSGTCAFFSEQGSSASQLTAAKIMGVIARLPDCDGQAADAVSAYTQVKLEDAPRLLRIPKSHCPEYGHVFHDTNGLNSWSDTEDPSRTKFVWTPTSRIVVGKTVRRNSIGTWMEKSTELGMSVCSSKTRIILIGFCG